MSADQRATIMKGYLNENIGGTEHMSYAEWAEDHIQDAVVAFQIGTRMLDEDEPFDSFSESDRCFEVYTITDREGFIAQMNEYNDEDEEIIPGESPDPDWMNP